MSLRFSYVNITFKSGIPVNNRAYNDSMKNIKVISVFGTRPEAIKMVPLIKELEGTEAVQSIVCVTAQHREMLDQVLDVFDIRPDYDLGLMRPGQTPATITASVLDGLMSVLEETMPDLLLCHGDTTTSLAAALCAFYMQIPVGHVEAGMRTYDRYSPFPEEMNRTLISRIAVLHFAPTLANRDNLLREGIRDGIFVTGNTVIDALRSLVKEDYRFRTRELTGFDFSHYRAILLTVHRRENLGEPMKQIFHAVRQIVDEYPDTVVIYPMHKNPRVREPAVRILGGHARILLIEPIEVDELHNLISRCYLVLTDSGGLQEEAPALGKPVLVLREETERPEAVEAGSAKVAGVQTERIVRVAGRLLRDSDSYEKMSQAVNPYGDGHASPRIVSAILSYFGLCGNDPG